jgi:hypothetical protein
MSKIEDYGFVDLKILHEGYSEYSLEDGTIIRARAVLLKVIKENNNLKLNERTFAVSFSPKSMKGSASPSILPPDEIVKSIKKQNMEFESLGENWNEYELSTGETIKMKALLVGASLTSTYDENGDPIYAVQIQTIHRIIKK